MPPIAIAGGVFILIVVAALAIARRGGGSRRVDQRIEQVVDNVAAIEQEVEVASVTQRRRDLVPFVRKFTEGRPFFDRLEMRLIAAGLPLRVTEFVAIWFASGLGMLIIGAIVGRSLMLAVVLAIAGFWMPHGLLNYLYVKRRKTLETQLADALTMMASSLKAGYGILQGFQAAAEQLPPPISDEFWRVVKLVNLGMELNTALQRMGKRVQSYDYDIMITSIGIQIQTGGNLSALLETIATTIRERITLRREIDAATSQGKLSGLVLVLLPMGIAGALMVINPGYASYLFSTALGRNLLKFAAALQLTGIWIIKRLLNFEG